MKPSREFDIILQGASGFTGQLAARELALRAPEGLRWAVAGRSAPRIAAIANQHDVPYVIADGLQWSAVSELAQRTRVVLSCAGPFRRYGTPLVDACVQAGTHYADLSGELPWIQDIVKRHHTQCAAEGTTLIPASGFDSVPADLGVWALQQEMQSSQPVHGFFSIRGGINGGTLHSGLALGEDGHLQATASRPSAKAKVFAVPSLQRWAAPFLMAPVNESVVHRSAILLAEQQHGYGNDFSYDEHMLLPSRWQAHSMSAVLSLSTTMLNSSWGRKLLHRFGPQPGQGPSEESQRNGFAHLTLIAGSLESPSCTRQWHWSGDPSNLITVRCLVQTGLALAAGDAQSGGVLTPATALGHRLLQRLQEIEAVRVQPCTS